MGKLWARKLRHEYQRIDPNSLDSLLEALENPDLFLPYERRYETLTQEQLSELIWDAKRLHWQMLDLGCCGLESLPDALGELDDLYFLCLGNLTGLLKELSSNGIIGASNLFLHLPNSIYQLSNLRILDLSILPEITSLPEINEKSSKLMVIDLRGSGLTSLPKSIANFRELQVLSLGVSNDFTELSDEICRLPKLRQLDLSRSNIASLPDSIGQLKSLERLDLSYCHLKNIPYGLVQLGLPFVTDGEYKEICVNLTRVTLDEGDISLFSKPRELIEAYYKNLVSESCSECKVIFLGDGAAGKSSIIERIVHDRFEAGSLPTDGVKMTKWSEYPDRTPLELNGKPLTVRFLDFGGQEIMHSMHRCFLTSHTVYVVVCESRDDAEIDSVAARWLETVKTFAPDCPVLLALNKADLNPNVTVNERALRAIHPQYCHMVRTSAKRDGDPGIRQLTESILREIPGCLSNLTGNRDFLNLKNELENMEADYILPEDFTGRCDRLHIQTELREMLLSWFQDLGIAYTYTTTFRMVYVLNPAWLTNGIYRLILRTENGGFLRHRVIRDTLGKSYSGDIRPDKTYTPQEMEFILHVMRKFEISMRVGEEYGDGIEMIPMKMEKTPPARYDEFRKAGALHLRWEAGYLPNNLVHRLMIRKYPELDPDKPLLEKCVWRTGGWFKSAGGEQEALAELTDKALDVYVRGNHDARVYMDSFRQMILQILRELNIEAKEYVFCTHDGREGKVSYKTAMSHYRNKKPEIYVEDLDLYISPQELLRENYLDLDKTQDFFISYNNEHDGEKARWIADTLRSSGYTVHFQAEDCKPGMDFLTWMNDAISHSRGFIAVWSGAYEKSEYCRMELNAATVRRHDLTNYKLLPVRAENVPVENALFKSVVYIDVFSDDEAVNRKELLRAAAVLRG